MRRRGFTLVELLVMIAIISLLIAIMLPGLGRAKAAARRTACLANQHSLTKSVHLYVNDCNTLIPREAQLLWLAPLAGYGQVEKVRYCPEVKETVPSEAFPGTVSKAWAVRSYGQPGTLNGGAYAFNYSLYNSSYRSQTIQQDEDTNLDDADDQNGIPVLAAGTMPLSAGPKMYRLPIAQQAALIPVFVDGIWPEVGPAPNDVVPVDLDAGFYMGGTASMNQMDRVCIRRHAEAVNVSFFDGHAETVPLQKLWTLRWNSDWRDPKPLPRIP